MPSRLQGTARRLRRFGTALENTALVLLLTAMIVVAVGQIVMRLAFSSGFVWADELLKLMVLWIALIASIAASRNARHLRIDVLSHVIPPRLAPLPRFIADAFAAFICGLLAWQSWRYVQLAREFGDTVLIDVPAWLVYGIMPLAFALMTWHFLVAAINESLRLAGVNRNEPA